MGGRRVSWCRRRALVAHRCRTLRTGFLLGIGALASADIALVATGVDECSPGGFAAPGHGLPPKQSKQQNDRQRDADEPEKCTTSKTHISLHTPRIEPSAAANVPQGNQEARCSSFFPMASALPARSSSRLSRGTACPGTRQPDRPARQHGRHRAAGDDADRNLRIGRVERRHAGDGQAPVGQLEAHDLPGDLPPGVHPRDDLLARVAPLPEMNPAHEIEVGRLRDEQVLRRAGDGGHARTNGKPVPMAGRRVLTLELRADRGRHQCCGAR